MAQMVRALQPGLCRVERLRFEAGLFLIRFISLVYLVLYKLVLTFCLPVLLRDHWPVDTGRVRTKRPAEFSFRNTRKIKLFEAV